MREYLENLAIIFGIIGFAIVCVASIIVPLALAVNVNGAFLLLWLLFPFLLAALTTWM